MTTNEDLQSLIDSCCPICSDIPSVPVSLNILSCKCRHKIVYCLTCVRDCLNLNGYTNGTKENSLSECPLCRAPFTSNPQIFRYDTTRRQNGINWTKVYTVVDALIPLLDEAHGETDCPRNCDWTGLRKDVRDHLQVCPNTYRFNCSSCRQMFDTKTFIQHANVSKTSYNRSCYNMALKCQKCDEIFAEQSTLTAHLESSHPPIKCKLCQLEFTTYNPDRTSEYHEHFEQCAMERIAKLTEKLNI